MIFTSKGNESNGSRNTPISIETLQRSGATPLMFTNEIQFNSRIGDDFGRDIVEIKWDYYIYYNGVEVYSFDSETAFYIDEINIKATIQQCEDVINKTYKQLQVSWNNRKTNEVNFFPSIQDIQQDTFDEVVQRLIQTLDGEQ